MSVVPYFFKSRRPANAKILFFRWVGSEAQYEEERITCHALAVDWQPAYRFQELGEPGLHNVLVAVGLTFFYGVSSLTTVGLGIQASLSHRTCENNSVL